MLNTFWFRQREKSFFPRARYRRTVGALRSRGVPAIPWERSPSSRGCNMFASEIMYIVPSPSPFSPVFYFFLCPIVFFVPFRRTLDTRSPSSLLFWCTFAHVAVDPIMTRACARVYETACTEIAHAFRRAWMNGYTICGQTLKSNQYKHDILNHGYYEIIIIFGENY